MNQSLFNTTLQVFARHLADEMRYINYAAEWSRPPLSALMPQFVRLLNHHPKKIGSILEQAYLATFPKPKPGNINQLSANPLFAKDQEYYLDEYKVSAIGDKPQGLVHNKELAEELSTLAMPLATTFARLRSEQENEHRTLERICFALGPIYQLVDEVQEVGWELVECADQWRQLSEPERLNLERQLITRF